MNFTSETYPIEKLSDIAERLRSLEATFLKVPAAGGQRNSKLEVFIIILTKQRYKIAFSLTQAHTDI